jgi:BASS family bile acid:Na+ symporter
MAVIAWEELDLLNGLNRVLERWMPLLTPLGVLVGILASAQLKDYKQLVIWIFAGMTFIGSLGANFTDLGRVVRQPMPIIVNLMILHLVMPLIGWAVANAMFPGDVLTETGFILLFAIPTGVVSLVWVSIYRGNIALTLTLILVDTLLSPFITPATLSLFVGAKVQIDTWGMMQGLLWMIVIPSLAGMTLNQMTRGQIKQNWGPKLAPFTKIGLFTVVAINSAVVAPYLKEAGTDILFMIASTIGIVALGYALGWLVSQWLGWGRDVTIAMTFNTGMRNLSAGAVLAIAFFPPPVALPVITGMLFQQILASLFGFALAKTGKRAVAL